VAVEEALFPERGLGSGGLLHRLEGLTRLDRLRWRIVAAIAIGWVPLLLLGVADRLATGRADPLLRDLSVHVRLLVAVPLLLVAEAVLNALSARAVRRLDDEGFIGDEGDARARFTRLVERVERSSRAYAPELVLLALSLLAGIATLVGWTKPAGVIGVASDAPLSAARVYYGVIALPLSLFLFTRALWRWGIWTRMLGGLARQPLRVEPGHPDRRGGIGFLKQPSLGFQAIFLVAISCVLSATWATRVLYEGAHVMEFQTELFAFMLLGLALAFGPLFVFTPRLYFNARRGRRQYDALATDYARRFRERWLSHGPRDDLLGSADIQSFADLSTTYRENAERASAVLFSRRDPLALVVLLFLPMVPLLLTEVPFDTLMKKIGSMVLGVH
jgi:hypothetical protein